MANRCIIIERQTMFRIKEIMSQRGMTSRGLARRMDVTPQYISNIIRETGSVSVNVLKRIADELQVPVSALFEDYLTKQDAVNELYCPHCQKPIRVEITLNGVHEQPGGEG